MEPISYETADLSPAESLVSLAEFILERRDGLLEGAYEVEIANIDEGATMNLVSFGVSVKQGVRFKLNIDLMHRKR